MLVPVTKALVNVDVNVDVDVDANGDAAVKTVKTAMARHAREIKNNP